MPSYYFIPFESGTNVLDADYRDLIEAHYQEVTGGTMASVNDSVEPRTSWIAKTTDEWQSYLLGVLPNPLDISKTQKIQQLEAAAYQSMSTFQSSALGSPHTYLAGQVDMTKLAADYTYVKSTDYKGETIDWYTVETDSYVAHTGAQLAQVFLDGRSFITTESNKLDGLRQQVKACTTIDQVNAITWS